MNNSTNNMNVGIITGSNNNFNQNNNFKQKNVYNNGGGNKPDDPAGAGLAACMAAFAVTAVIAVSYLHNYETIFFWLKLGVMTSGALHLLTLVSQSLDNSYRYRDSIAPTGGVILMALLVWLTTTTFNALPAEALTIAARPTVALAYFPQMLEVWARFNNDGHRIILENLTSAFLLAAGTLFNLAFGLQQLIESVGRAKQISFLAIVSHWLRFFKTGGVFVGTVATLGAYLAISGVFTRHMS